MGFIRICVRLYNKQQRVINSLEECVTLSTQRFRTRNRSQNSSHEFYATEDLRRNVTSPLAGHAFYSVVIKRTTKSDKIEARIASNIVFEKIVVK